MGEETSPDFQRFVSPLRRYKIASLIVGVAVLVVSVMLAGRVTGQVTYEASLDVKPKVEASATELAAVLAGSGLPAIGAASASAPISEIVAYYTQDDLGKDLDLPDDLLIAVSVDLAAERVQINLSHSSLESLEQALTALTDGFLHVRSADLERDLTGSSSGVDRQLAIVEQRLAELGDTPNDQTIRSSLAYQQASLTAVAELLAEYPLDALGVEFDVVGAPAEVATSTIAQMALGIVLASLLAMLALGIWYALDDRIVSRRDLQRASLGAPLVGVLGSGNRTGSIAVAGGIAKRRPNGVESIQIHLTSGGLTAVATDLASDLNDVDPALAVRILEVGQRADGLKSTGTGVLDLVLVEWEKTTRRSLVEVLSQLRFAGSSEPCVVVGQVPDGDLRSMLE
jgi:hypothetical protein